jgi:4-hydroxyphenylpyruvate dioxygenase
MRPRPTNARWSAAPGPVPAKVEVMELHIPSVHGAGTSRIYFVDRYKEFSIYDVDFTPIPTVDPHPPSLAGLHFFGIVQYIGNDRTDDWTEFYSALFGFTALPAEQRFGILPKGRILRSPCGSFHLQLIEPEPGVLDVEDDECLQRVGLGTPDVPATVAACARAAWSSSPPRGVQFDSRGAVTRTALGGVMFELVHHAGKT